MLKVEFVGNIGADAEIKDFNGKRYIAFNVATSERFKDAQARQSGKPDNVGKLS